MQAQPPSRESEHWKHWNALSVCSELADYYRRTWEPKAVKVNAKIVVDLLCDAEIDFVMIGAHGISGWRSQPQSSQDVDLLIARHQHSRAVDVISKRFRRLMRSDDSNATRFADPVSRKTVIDVKKTGSALSRIILENALVVTGAFGVPDLEAALVARIANVQAVDQCWSKRHWAAADIYCVVEQNKNELDLRKLKQLCNSINKGNGSKTEKIVRAILANRMIRFE